MQESVWFTIKSGPNQFISTSLMQCPRRALAEGFPGCSLFCVVESRTHIILLGVYFLPEGSGSLREPTKCGHFGQAFQECGDRLGWRSGLWRCNETPGTSVTDDGLFCYTHRAVKPEL